MIPMECSKCKAPSAEGKSYCADCGALLNPGVGSLDPGLRQHIQSTIKEELKDQKVVEIEVIETIVTRLSTWAKLLGYFVGIPFALLIFVLGILGYKSYSDFSGLVKEAEIKIKPTLEQARIDAEQIKRQSESLKSQYAELDSEAAKYRELDQRVGTLTAKVDQIAEKIEFQPSTSLSEELKKKLSSSLSSYQIYMQNLGLKLKSGSVGVSIRPRSEMTSGGISYYDPQQNAIVVEGSYANDADMVLLEYTRRVLFSSVALHSTNRLTYLAINYGLASYFPCSFKNNSMFGSVSAGAHPAEFKAWNLNNERKFSEIRPNDSSAEVDGREIWGGVFWEIRQVLGQSTADKLLFSSWTSFRSSDYLVSPSAFVRKILEIDQSIQRDNHANEIRAIFAKRGMAV